MALAAIAVAVAVAVVVVVVVAKRAPRRLVVSLLLEWFCWFFRVKGVGGVGGWGGDVNVHTDAKMKTEQHLEMPTMMTMSMAMMHLMMI